MNPLAVKFNGPDCSGTLPRNGLTDMIDAIPRQRLTLIIAGAGYGKTTFAAQACETLGLRQVWLRPDEQDMTMERMVAKAAHGIQTHFPDFQWPVEIPSSSLACRFAQALETAVTRDIFIILDDCHCLPARACRFFQNLLERFLPFFHLILIGRRLPDIKFSRLAARGQVLRISGADLALSRSEMIEIFGFEQRVPDQDISLLSHKTRGWVSGIILFNQMARGIGGPGTGEAIARLKGCHGLIRDYFEENVYEGLERQLQVFLLKTAVLTRLDADFINEFLETDKALDYLRRLEDLTGFIVSVDEDRDRFYCHPLFRDFLEDRIRVELGADYRKNLNSNAALLYEKNGQGPKALTHHILAGNIPKAAGLMNRFARPVIKQDSPLMLKSLLSVIPAHYMDDEPWFQYLQAGYYGLCSRLTLAVNAYERLLKIFKKQKDGQGECMVLMELAEHYLARGRIRQSEQAYARILGKNSLDPYLNTIVMGHLIRVLALAGRHGRADTYAAKALAMVDKCDGTQLDMGRAWISAAQGYRYAFSGSYQKALEMGKDAKQRFSRLGRDRFLFSAYFLISYACFYLGRFSKGMDTAREGMALAREKGIRDEFTESLGLMLARNGLELPGISRTDIAFYRKKIQKSTAYFENRNFPGGLAQACLAGHRARLALGEPGRAEKSLRHGLAALENIRMPLVKNELKLALADLLLFNGKTDDNEEAIALLKAAEKELCHSGWHMARVSGIFARYYWTRGHWETAHKHMVYSLKISQEESFDPWVIKETRALPILTSLYAMDAMAAYIEKIVTRMGAGAIPGLNDLGPHSKENIKKAAGRLRALIPLPCPPAINASFFGRFRLFVGKRQIHSGQWKSRKALTLLKYLLAMGSYIEKEILMELLWPEEDPCKSGQRFHVALATVRKTLEPDIPKGIRSAYIKRSGQAYRIDITPKGQVDTNRFIREIRSGDRAATPETAMAHYTLATNLYSGDFLEEEVYEQWCVRKRTRYKEAFFSVLNKIMDYHYGEKDYKKAIQTAETYLKMDPFAEGVVRSLMQYHYDAGNAPMVSRLFQNFTRAVQKEFNCDISPRTRKLYQQLTRPRPDVWDTRMLESFKISGSL